MYVTNIPHPLERQGLILLFVTTIWYWVGPYLNENGHSLNNNPVFGQATSTIYNNKTVLQLVLRNAEIEK